MVDRINGKSSLFWYFFWKQTASLINVPAPDLMAEKFEMLSFWLTKRVEDPSEEFILDKIDTFWDILMTDKRSFEYPVQNGPMDIA